MKITYANNKLAKICNSAKELTRHYGSVCGKLIGKRLQQIDAASSLEVVRAIPQARCHELLGDRQGQLSVDIEHPKRLIFEPNHDPRPIKDDGGLDWTSVTDVIIIEIVDYHGN